MSITVIVPAHNEAAVIEAKVENLQVLASQVEACHIVIALDGCDDETASLAAEAIQRCGLNANCTVVNYPNNIGKTAVLNAQVTAATADLVVLTDASAMLSEDALAKSAQHFLDTSVGVVCATYLLGRPANEGERVFWAQQARIKSDEAALGAPMGAHGAFYVIRRSLWRPIPEDTINDDFVIPMTIVLRGHAAIYDRTIVAVEDECSSPRQEFRRRIRIGAGNLQQTLRLVSLGNPRRAELAFMFLSGKGLRGILPLLVLAALVANVLLAVAGDAAYQGILALVAGASLAIVLGNATGLGKRSPLFAKISYIAVGYVASAIGSLLFLTRLQGGVWKTSLARKRAAG